MTRLVGSRRPGVLRQLRPGDRLTARYFNQQFGVLARGIGIPAPRTVPAEPVAPGETETPAEGGIAIDYFTVNFESSNGNTLSAFRPSTGTNFTIAKPWNLRGADGERTVSGELQAITPAYETGHQSTPAEGDILCAEVGEAATGITGADWIDLNVAGRMWAEVS